MNQNDSQIRRPHWLHILAPLGSGIIFVAALLLIGRELEGVRLHDVLVSLQQIGSWPIAGAITLTTLSYLVMTGYDHLGVRYVGHRMGLGQASFASFLGYAFSNNLGTLLGAGAVRLRIYGAWGLSGRQILSLLLFTSSSVWLGLATLAGIVLLFRPIPANVDLPLLHGSTLLLGLVLVALVGTYLAMCRWWRRSIHVRAWTFQWPSIRLAGGQLLIGSLDWLLASLVLYVLLSPAAEVPFVTFLAVFLLAQLVGLVSNVPGGLGVFEMVLLLMLGPLVEHEVMLSTLIMFRAIYYLLPLTLAGLSLGGFELLRHRGRIEVTYAGYQRFLGPMAPLAIAALMFIAGLSMLFAGVVPTAHWRLHRLHDFLPLPAIELSHLLGSVVGTLLLFLAVALYRRVNAAYGLAAVLLGAGVLLSLLRGLHWEVALAQGLVLATLLPCRRRFYRTARLLEPRTGWPWLVAVGLAVGASVALGFFVFRQTSYHEELWWQMALTGDAPRFLRAALASCLLMLVLSAAWLLRPARVTAIRPGPEDLDVAQRISALFPRTYAHLALLGDKQLLFNPQRDGFVMYGMQGGSWTAMGDPVATTTQQQEELAWQFRERCDRHGVRCLFYQVHAANIPLYLDMGLSLVKLGEAARVLLSDFTMEGGNRKSLRGDVNRAVKAGCSFEILSAQQAVPLLPQLKVVSDAWLTLKQGEEKGFSLGFFDYDYLARFPIAVVWRQGRVVAFANFWSGGGEELSPDLIRHAPDAPPSTMNFLITQLMFWGKAKRYRWFNLGGAPLSGLEDRTLAPLWNRLGAQLYRHGEHFYNFEGLRQFKEKFNPVWEPKYLAAPAGLSLPWALLDLMRLISQHAAKKNGHAPQP
jgi:phosphatidylglycerol lysyltransferase